MTWTDLLAIAGVFLTVMVLLYLFIGDNALFRLITYIFIGVAAGYVAVLVIFQVLLPRFLTLLQSGSLPFLALGLIPFALGLLLFAKLSAGASPVGSLPMGILVGVGAAVAVGGAVFGTLAGQIGGTISLFSLRQGGDVLSRLLEGLFILVGTICTLAYFQFSTRTRTAVGEAEAPVRRAALLQILAKVGQIFIGITLGAVFAGVYSAALSALVERIGFIFGVITTYFKF